MGHNICPICSSELSDDKYYLDGMLSPLLEQHEECPNKHYARRFVTGHMVTEVEAKEYLITSYLSDYQTTKLQRFQYQLAILKEKIKWRLSGGVR